VRFAGRVSESHCEIERGDIAYAARLLVMKDMEEVDHSAIQLEWVATSLELALLQPF
jgi:hypothetical protein